MAPQGEAQVSLLLPNWAVAAGAYLGTHVCHIALCHSSFTVEYQTPDSSDVRCSVHGDLPLDSDALKSPAPC